MTIMRHALITGGAGFIGSSLTRYLLGQGYGVEVLDDLSTGSAGNLPSDPHLRLTISRIFSGPLLETAVLRADLIFHLAAVVGVQRVLERPRETIETNVLATQCVLECAAKHKRPVLITSSSEVYGNSIRCKEDDDLTIQPGIRWGYAAAKLLDEFTAAAYHQEGAPVVVVRLFNTIGPRQTGRYGMVVPTFIEQALANRPITIHGNGLQRRSFTWVEDTVKAMLALLLCPESNGEIVNIGHSEDISINSLAALVKRITKSESPIQRSLVPGAYGHKFKDIDCRVPDLTKIHRLIGYRTSTNLTEMICRILEYREKHQLPTSGQTP